MMKQVQIPLNVCIPQSLEKWKQSKGIKEEGRRFERRMKCNKTITEPIKTYGGMEEKKLSKKYWDDLDKKLRRDRLLSIIPKVFLGWFILLT